MAGGSGPAGPALAQFSTYNFRWVNQNQLLGGLYTLSSLRGKRRVTDLKRNNY